MVSEEDIAFELAEIDASVAGSDARDVLHACATLASDAGFSAHDFVLQWESFSLNESLPNARPTLRALALFRETLRPRIVAAGALTAPRPPSPPALSASELSNPSDADFYAQSDAAVAPPPMADEPHEPPRSAAAPLAEPRLEAMLLADDGFSGEEGPAAAIGAKIDVISEQQRQTRFMASPLEDRAVALDVQLEACRSVLAEAAGVGDLSTPFDDVLLEEVVVFGRVCAEEPEDVAVSNPKLTASNALLQAPLSNRSARVKLLLSEVDHAVFPGQAVAVTATNPSGALLIPRLITSLPPLPLAPSSMRPPMDPDAVVGRSFHIVLASGPYTTSDAIDYAPFAALINAVLQSPPDILVLVGPFVDIDHPLLHTLQAEFGDVFRNEFASQLARLDGVPTRVVVVPSTQDAVNDFCVLPQPPFDPALFASCGSNIVLAPNPCVLRVDGGALTIGVCSADVAKHVAGQLVLSPQRSKDRMHALCESIVGQRSFYPLHPPDESVGIEYSQLSLLAFPSFTPDILVLPSELATFAKRVRVPSADGSAAAATTTLCINPGRVAKGVTIGRFSRLVVGPSASSAKVEVFHL